jgi:transcriptional regulator
MYIPDLYKNEDQASIDHFIHENGFAILINQLEGKIVATHIPLQLETNEQGKQMLYGHISKENPQWQSFESNDKILAIFSGAHSYISPSWYDHENVPTWNYTAVHLYGTIRIIEGEALLTSLKKLTNKYEAKSENPMTVEGLSAKAMLQIRGIVGFEIEINEIQAVHKMSQNRDDKNYHNIITELEKTGEGNAIAVAKEMSKCRK